jgi:hypothetical protein
MEPICRTLKAAVAVPAIATAPQPINTYRLLVILSVSEGQTLAAGAGFGCFFKLAMSAQIVRDGLCSAAAPAFGQHPSVFQENPRGDAAAGLHSYAANDRSERENTSLRRLH